MDRLGRYRIVKEIGRGAMGIVYLATDPTIGRPVAIKTVRLRDVDDAQQREKLRERLFREARSAGVLSHPNIVTIYDMAEEDGVAYIAMEYVDGSTLDDLMSTGKALHSDKVFGILRQTASALDYAHSKGIVHRDIKPANIMLGRDGNVKVTDFGIAKINAADDSFTMKGTMVGTPNYMSPEQVQGHEVTGRSDQFSLAVIAYEILTGERPFPGTQLSTVVYKIVTEEPLSPQKLNRTLGASIDGVLLKALSKKPPNRYRTCAEFVGSLETTCAATKGWIPIVRGASLDSSTFSGVAPEVSPAGIPKTPSRKKDPGATSPLRAEPKKESRVLPLAAALLMVVGVFSLLTWQGGERTSASQAEVKSDSKPDSKPRPPAEVPPSSVQPQTTPAPKPEATSDGPPGATPDPPPSEAGAAKPSAMGPPQHHDAALPAPILPKPAQVAVVSRLTGKSQDLALATNPFGATATVDGGASCTTPCTLPVSPGLHAISIRLEGYQEERREVRVGTEAEEVPLISLHRSEGTLMIATTPPGATITINDKVQAHLTPYQFNLPLGTYTVVVEKDGKRQVNRVEIRNGNTNWVKISLD